MNNFILWFKDIGLENLPQVGGKNAGLGEMFSELKELDIKVPDGFVLTVDAYHYFLKKTGLDEKIKTILEGLNTENLKDLQTKGKTIRQAILKAELPEEIALGLKEAYHTLESYYGPDVDVAVRSSATAEDLPGASFAGQQETYLNIVGIDELLKAVKKCIASLFTDRAISYREDKGFGHLNVALSVGIQKMVRSDLAASGVIFTIDPETGFDKVIVIQGSYGLGETIVQGRVVPDEFVVFKPTLNEGYKAILSKTLGKKNIKLVYGKIGTQNIKVSKNAQNRFCLKDDEILELARMAVKIEEHFSKKYQRYQPMDIEWAKDGKLDQIFIVQARSETVHSIAEKEIYREYKLKADGRLLTTGIAVGTKIASGRVRIIKSVKNIGSFKENEILVTEITNPDWEPIMKIAAAIITEKGGRTSHAAIVSRELGIPCIVGTGNATKILQNGQLVTVDCSSGEIGKVYEGMVPYQVIEHKLAKIPQTKTKVMVNIGSPDEAFKYHYLPVKGVGLGRIEFTIASEIRIHPNALIDYKKLKNKKLIAKINGLTQGYLNKTRFYVDKLAEGIAKIGAAFWPEEVIIRFSDFKTNEYHQLLGGDFYEPAEENPMLGWRGASRYYHPKFKKAFGLECQAIKKVRDEIGLKNIVPMVPFCRTPEEGRRVLEIMARYGLKRPEVKIYVMGEIPSNILLIDEFLEIFDGISIGSNDLTQLTLGLDRDSNIVASIANENNLAVKKMIKEVIEKCQAKGKYIGICGQAPSDYPEFVEFLVKEGIKSISLNPDTVIKTILMIKKYEDSFL